MSSKQKEEVKMWPVLILSWLPGITGLFVDRVDNEGHSQANILGTVESSDLDNSS